MLRVLGSRRPLCDGLSRRDLLRAGGLGFAGMTLPQLLHWKEQSAEAASHSQPSFGRAKAVILLHLYGSPSQLEWADMKPDAPAEIRGELGGISSTLPGCDVCELLPNLAKVMDRTSVIRSLTHDYPIHGVAYALTGVPAIDVAMELSPHDPQHWPFVGSVIDYLEKRDQPSARRSVPANMALPFPFSSRRKGEVPRAGPYAAFLGSQHNPVWTNYVGKATRGIDKVLGELRFTDPDPYIGMAPESYFYVPAATELSSGITLDRLNRRRSLLGQLDDRLRATQRRAEFDQLDRYQQMAFGILESEALRGALDLRREQRSVRESYGQTLFGQACLAARRLVEAGSRIVSVFWDEFGLAGHAWDTHYNHFQRMREALCPGLDQAWYGLITDLDARGLLDETLVVCTSEHGRTPQINKAGGRDHWSRVYTSLMAGGGVKRGFVLGASDKHGSDVADRPVSPKDVLATMYHLLGIDHHQTITDALSRPLPLVEGDVLTELLA